MLALIVDEAVVQDGYMNALTDGFGECMSTNDLLVLLSVLLAVVVVAVLAVALILVRQGLTRISDGLATLGGALEASRPSTCARSSPRSRRSTRSSTSSWARCPGIGRKAAIVAERRPR